jgi:hypothetical protein
MEGMIAQVVVAIGRVLFKEVQLRLFVPQSGGRFGLGGYRQPMAGCELILPRPPPGDPGADFPNTFRDPAENGQSGPPSGIF